MKLIVGFSRPKSKKSLSHVIRYYMKTPYTHVYIRFWSEKYKRELLYEASHGSCHFQEYNNFKEHNLICDEFSCEVTDEKKTDIVRFCIDNAQKSYGFWTLVGILLGKNIGKDGDKSFICSELVSKALGISDSDFYTPKELYNYALQNMEKLLT